MTTPWRDGVRQAETIARATFNGFLESDLMPGGMQAPALIWAAAFLVAPSIFFPAQYMSKYPFLRHYFPAKVEGAIWDDRLLYLLMSAGAMGLVSVVLWDTLFPARRDAFVLTPLPVAVSIQMLGRLGGLVMLALAFAAALNLMPGFTFPFTSAASFGQMPRWMVGHLVSTTAADAFVFFSITTLQGVVILAFGRRAAARLAAVAQTATVLTLLLMLLFIGPIRHVVQAGHPPGPSFGPGVAVPSPLVVSWALRVDRRDATAGDDGAGGTGSAGGRPALYLHRRDLRVWRTSGCWCARWKPRRDRRDCGS